MNDLPMEAFDQTMNEAAERLQNVMTYGTSLLQSEIHESAPVNALDAAVDAPTTSEQRPLVNPLYATFNETTRKWERRVDKLTGKTVWPWPQLYFKDRVALSDRIYEIDRHGAYVLIFKFTKKLLKKMKREREATPVDPVFI